MRLFPISHEGCNKQFCDLNTKYTFCQATIKRFLKLGISPARVIVITTNENQTRLAKEQTSRLGVLSQNIYQVSESWGYPGVMVKAAEIVERHDPDAIIINTPSDQYIVEGEEFERAIYGAIKEATENRIAVVGVRITDLVTATGCGHVVYGDDEADENGFRRMANFVEKPDEETADRLMRQAGSACNTGINVWAAKALLAFIDTKMIIMRKTEAAERNAKWELRTDEFLKTLPDVYAISGEFEWYDCGTLQALYEISPKTPNHKNASIGGGEIDRTDCLESLFYAPEGFRLHATGFRGVAGIVNIVRINGAWRPICCIINLADSQRVKELAEDVISSKLVLSVGFGLNAPDCVPMRSNVSKEVIFGFVGVRNCIVNIHKNPDGIFDVFMAQQNYDDVAHEDL